jgi:hypothetical protein
MKTRIFVTLLVAFVAAAASGTTQARPATANDPPNIDLSFNLGILSAIPEPADDPLLDASGAPVLDATGKPVSDPNERFHKVIPGVFDPAHTHLVQSTWLDGIGCPTNAKVAEYPATQPTGTYTDPACATADQKDKHVEGLLMVKTGPTSNNASAVAELKKVRGTTPTELGYDIRKVGPTTADPRGSHCGAGAPRFDIVAQDGTYYFIGCNSPPADSQTSSGQGWTRLRWGGTLPLMAYCYPANGVMSATCPAPFALAVVQGPVNRVVIVFDEGQDASGGPDQFGGAVLDNVDYNGTLVGRGPAGPGLAEDKSKDDDDDD